MSVIEACEAYLSSIHTGQRLIIKSNRNLYNEYRTTRLE